MSDVDISSMRTGEELLLRELERNASQRFDDHGFPSLAGQICASAADYPEFLRRHEVWVARSNNKPIGFVAASDLEGIYYVQEMNVCLNYGRQGIGTRLLRLVIQRARWSDYAAVALSTFRDVPFNGAFYQRHGFMHVDPKTVPDFLRNRHEADIPEGIHPATRTLMIKRL